jgi:hypothetical protein
MFPVQPSSGIAPYGTTKRKHLVLPGARHASLWECSLSTSILRTKHITRSTAVVRPLINVGGGFQREPVRIAWLFRRWVVTAYAGAHTVPKVKM